MQRNTSLISIEFTSDSAQELLGRQSVRTTFKISERAIEALSILAMQLGIKQKSLFDHLMDDSKVLKQIAEGAEEYRPPKQRVAKTYVISRKTLQNLEVVSQGYGVPRDLLVEVSIERIFPLLVQERQKHEGRKRILAKMESVLREGEQVFAMVNESLEKDDPVYRRALQMMRSIQTCYDEVEGSVDKGRKIEEL